MTEGDKATLLEELTAALTPTQRQPGDVTITEVAKAAGICYAAAKGQLEAMVEAGELVTEEVLDEGHKTKVFRRKGHNGTD